MKCVLKNLNLLLTENQKSKLFKVFLLAILSGVMETGVIACIYSFINLLTNADGLSDHVIYRFLSEKMGGIQPNTFIIQMAFTVSAMCALKALILWSSNYMNFVFSNTFFYELSKGIYESYLYNDYAKITQSNSADIVKCLTDDTRQVYELIKDLMRMVMEIFTVAFVILYLVVQAPRLMGLFGLLSFLLFAPVKTRLSKPLRMYSAERLRSISHYIKLMNETSGAIKMIKINHLENTFEDEFLDAIEKVKNCTIKTDTYGFLPKLLIENIGLFIIFAVIGIMGICGSDLMSLLPILATMAMAIYKVFPGFSRIATYYTAIMRCSVSLENVLNHMETKRLRADNEEVNDCASEERHGISVVLDQVSFKFDDSNEMLLEDINLEIKENQSIAFIGETGAGKTTLADIILGLRNPTSGKVMADNKDVIEHPRWWGRLVGYVPQNIYLMDDSIKNNIVFKREYNEDKLIEVLKEAQIWNFIESLPEGWDTKVGEMGVRLSGGQRQRIGIARALYKNPAFLVLDEATSALDTDTENAIVETFEGLKGKMTILMIAHRLSTIEKCDCVYKIENKHLVPQTEKNGGKNER